MFSHFHSLESESNRLVSIYYLESSKCRESFWSSGSSVIRYSISLILATGAPKFSSEILDGLSSSIDFVCRRFKRPGASNPYLRCSRFCSLPPITSFYVLMELIEMEDGLEIRTCSKLSLLLCRNY